jgi:hypothetical protein
MLLLIFVPVLLQVRKRNTAAESAALNIHRPFTNRSEISSQFSVSQQQCLGRTRVSGINFPIDPSYLSSVDSHGFNSKSLWRADTTGAKSSRPKDAIDENDVLEDDKRNRMESLDVAVPTKSAMVDDDHEEYHC